MSKKDNVTVESQLSGDLISKLNHRLSSEKHKRYSQSTRNLVCQIIASGVSINELAETSGLRQQTIFNWLSLAKLKIRKIKVSDKNDPLPDCSKAVLMIGNKISLELPDRLLNSDFFSCLLGTTLC